MQKISPAIIFFIVSIIIVASWFKSGLYFGGAEMGLSPFYNPSRYYDIQQFIWWDDVVPGALVPQFITAIPLYFILSILQNFFSPLILQALLFFVLLFLMGYGMYLFAVDVLRENKRVYAIAGGLFYTFNSYLMIEVWHRFLYTGIFLAAALPILILFWQKWLREGKVNSLVIFLFGNLAFSYMYGNLTSAIAVWLLLLLMTVAKAIFPWQGKKVLLAISYKFAIGFLLFLFTNLWWLIPVFRVSTQVLPQQHNIEDNIGTLISISRQTIPPFILQYANPFYLFYTKELGQIYTNFLFLILPWIPAVVIFIGLFYSLKRKYFAAIGLFYLIAIIIAKGAASPFGYPYIWGFTKIFFLGVIRNPFEKLGILLPFFGSILFVIGLENVFIYIKKKYGSFVSKSIIFTILLSVLIYAFPMFTGGVFNKPDNSLKIKVPLFYEQANDWLKKQDDREGNILHLPFSGRDVVTYKWPNGYHGVEVNEILFTSLPSITRNTGIKRIDDTLMSLSYLFIAPYSDDKSFILRALQNLNVKYIVLHKDTVWTDKDTYGDIGPLLNPEVIEMELNKLKFLQKKAQFGDLVIYKLADEYYKKIFFISDRAQIVYPGQTDIMQIFSLTDKGKDLVTPLTETKIDLLKNKSVIVFPEKQINYWESTGSAKMAQITEDALKQLPEIRNYFNSIGYIQSSKISSNLILATDKIIRIYQQAISSKMAPGLQQITEYELLIQNILNEYTEDLSIHLMFGKNISNVLKLHVFILRQLGLDKIAQSIELDMIQKELLPSYRGKTAQDINRQVFKFDIAQAGIYQLLSDSIIKDRNLLINEEKISNIDNLSLNSGTYEISMDVVPSEISSKDVALKMRGISESSFSGQVLNIEKESPVKYRGKLKIDQSSFVMFSQSFNPGWMLTLFSDGKPTEVNQHFLGNLYSNAWWLKDAGQFDFEIEFTPQRNATIGALLSGIGWAVILVIALFTRLNKKS